MASGKITAPIKMDKLVVKLTVPRLFNLRIWVGMRLMRIGARIIGCTFKVDEV